MLPVIGLFINQRSFRAATLYFQTTVSSFLCLVLPPPPSCLQSLSTGPG